MHVLQVTQVGPLQFQLRYIPRDWSIAGDEAAVDALFRATYFADSDLQFVRVLSIEPTPAGKFLEYVNDWTTVG